MVDSLLSIYLSIYVVMKLHRDRFIQLTLIPDHSIIKNNVAIAKYPNVFKKGAF